MIANIPRIIFLEDSYKARESFNEITIIAGRSILWPCYAWKIAIPTRGNDHINPFGELVLKLSAQGLRTARDIANYCYPAPPGENHEREDLLLCVQSRLMARGYLDSSFEITDEGKKLLDEWDTEEIQYQSAIVYQDYDSGKLLPAIHIGVPEYPEILEVKGPIIKFKTDDTKYGEKFARKIIIEKNPPPAPSNKDVMQAFLRFSGRYSSYGFVRTSQLSEQPMPSLHIDGVPLIQGERENVLLHCQILLPRDSNDFLVSDGFGLGYSVSFKNYLIKNENELLNKLKTDPLVDKASDSPDADKKKVKVARIPYIFENARKTIQEWKDAGSPDTWDAVKKRKKEIQTATESLYDALEFAFASLCVKYPSEKWINLLSQSRYGQYSVTIEKAASRLGFTVTRDNSSLLYEPPGAFLEIHNSMYKLQPLMILAIMAASDEETHPFNDLANGFPDFLDFICEFKKIRNPLKHDDTSRQITIHVLEGLFAKTGKAIHLIFPKELPQDQIEMTINTGDLDSFREQRLKADLAIAEKFGNDLLYSMETNLRNTLYELKMSKESDTYTVNKMYSALQIALHSLNKTYSDRSKPEYDQWMADFLSESTFHRAVDSVRDYAQERAKEFGLLARDEQLPPNIKNVNEQRIRLVLRGGDISLQANCLAFLAVGADDVLSAVSKGTPDLVQFAAQLAEMRGHGNEAKIGNANLDNLENKLFNTIKELLGVIYG